MLVALPRFPIFPVILLTLLSAACGSSYRTTKVKQYTLGVTNNEPSLKAEFKDLIAAFNRYTGSQVLSYSDDLEAANSAIILTKGLKQRDGKVGWGQWLSETKSGGPVATPGSKPKRTIRYSMRLEFDLDYFTSRTNQNDEKESDRWHKAAFFRFKFICVNTVGYKDGKTTRRFS